MKKIILTIFVVLVAVGVLWYTKNSKPTKINTEIKTYRSSDLGISFSYPQILYASSTSEEVVLHHEVSFTHHDYCDFRGEITSTTDKLTDFHLSFHVVNKNIIETMKNESPYIPEENFLNGEVVPSSGFIDPFEVNGMKGFKIFEGAEGCGHTVYYLAASNSKTLVMQEEWITVFSGVIDVENKNAAEAVPGVINKEKAAEILNSILQTVEIN